MSADVLSMQTEAAAIAARRAAAIRQHPATISKQCPPAASLLHRIASLITTEQLPPARVIIMPNAEIIIDATGGDQIENTVRRWAGALDLVVTETAIDNDNGFAATQWCASGYDGSGHGVGTWWLITGRQLLPTPVVDRFGVGLGPIS